MRNLGTIKKTLANGITIDIQDVGQIDVKGYLVHFIKDNQIKGEALICCGDHITSIIEATPFHEVAEKVYDLLG